MVRTSLYLMLLFSLFIMGCKTTGHRYIDIKPPSFGAQFIPEQLNTLLTNSGFHRIEFSTRVIDPNAGITDTLNMKTGMVLDSSENLLMRYQHQTQSDLMVNVTIGKYKGDVKLEFYETAQKELSKESIGIYNQFIENLSSSIYDESDFTES